MDMMNLYKLYEKNYNKNYYKTKEIIKDKNISSNVYVPSNVVELVYNLIEKFKIQNVKYQFDDSIDDIELSCSYCGEDIHSDDFYFKTIENQDGGNTLLTKLMIYCSSDCFNKVEEELPTLIKPIVVNFSDNSELKQKFYKNFMYKVLKENKEELMKKNVSVYNLDMKISKYDITPQEFKMIIGP